MFICDETPAASHLLVADRDDRALTLWAQFVVGEELLFALETPVCRRLGAVGRVLLELLDLPAEVFEETHTGRETPDRQKRVSLTVAEFVGRRQQFVDAGLRERLGDESEQDGQPEKLPLCRVGVGRIDRRAIRGFGVEIEHGTEIEIDPGEVREVGDGGRQLRLELVVIRRVRIEGARAVPDPVEILDDRGIEKSVPGPEIALAFATARAIPIGLLDSATTVRTLGHTNECAAVVKEGCATPAIGARRVALSDVWTALPQPLLYRAGEVRVRMSIKPFALAALVLLAGLAPMAAASGPAPTQESTNSTADAYSGTHVSFATGESAIVGYAVGGDTVASAVEVQSASQVESNLGIGVGGDLGAVTDFAGAALSMDATAQASASVRAESGATITASDHRHGTLLVDAEDDQYVSLGLNASSEAETTGDGRVLVTTDSGTTAAVMVVGEGNATVNDDGNVTATVAAESRLVVRSYSDDRTEDDERTERLIANGTAAAEVYVDQRDGEQVNGTITYDSDTEVTVDAESESAVNVTIDRAEHQGKVVIASASQFEAESDDLTVRVDGQAAAQASSYSELRAAADGGSTSKYMVRNSASAEADAEVLVAVNHFSERSVSVTEDDGSSDDSESGDDSSSDGTDDGSTGSGDGPGFGIVAALLSLFGLGTLSARR